jgi:hypothetical protein
MTIVVLWYSEDAAELCCAADTRISGSGGTATDSGPKIFPVPVICFEGIPGKTIWHATHRPSFGFAYSGSTLSAMSTYALATACTQNLSGSPGSQRAVSAEAIANLFRTVAEHYILDLSSRLGVTELSTADGRTKYFFEGMIFGFCPVCHAFKAYKIKPSLDTGTCQVGITELPIAPDLQHAMGSGEKTFVELNEERVHKHGKPDPIRTLEEMLELETPKDVGGSIQYGASGRRGFRVLPVLNTDGVPADWTASFLGWNVANAGDIDGYAIGYNAISFD